VAANLIFPKSNDRAGIEGEQADKYKPPFFDFKHGCSLIAFKMDQVGLLEAELPSV
jgi:hypothetical protein